MLDLYSELLAVVQVLQRNEIPFVLVGGLAYSLHVELRATEDIDLMIRPDDWDRVPQLLHPLGFEQLAGPLDLSTIRIRRLTKIAQEDVLVLDFLLADGHYAEALQRPVYFNVQNLRIPVVEIPTLIKLKQGRMSAKDKSDIAGLEGLLTRE